MCPTPPSSIDWSLLYRLRRWVGLRLVRHEINLLLEELSRCARQNAKHAIECEEMLKPVAKIALSCGKGSYGVLTWINPAIVEAYIGGDIAQKDLIEKVVRLHFRRHMNGAFTQGAQQHLFFRTNHNPLVASQAHKKYEPYQH
jgi:hypothetical protein